MLTEDGDKSSYEWIQSNIVNGPRGKSIQSELSELSHRIQTFSIEASSSKNSDSSTFNMVDGIQSVNDTNWMYTLDSSIQNSWSYALSQIEGEDWYLQSFDGADFLSAQGILLSTLRRLKQSRKAITYSMENTVNTTYWNRMDDLDLSEWSNAYDTWEVEEEPPPAPPPPPPTVDNVVIAEEKIEVIEVDTSFRIEPIVAEPGVIKDGVIVDVPQKPACFDVGSNCEVLSGAEQDECCQKAVLTYLAKVEYPTQAKDLGVEGKVLLRFVVEKDGSITQIEKIRGDDMLAESAIRHIKNSEGKWTAGMNNGKSVRSWFVAPFTFKLR